MDRTSSRAAQGSALGEGVKREADLKRLRLEFPDDESMRISHEAISVIKRRQHRWLVLVLLDNEVGFVPPFRSPC